MRIRLTPTSPLHICAVHAHTQTDTHACTHPRFMARQYEGAQESQPAPGLAPPQLPSLAVTLPSPSLHSFLFPGLLLSTCVSFSYSPSSLCWLSAVSLCLFVSQSLFLSHWASLSYSPPPFPWTLHLSCLCCSSAQQFLGTSTATPEPQSNGKEKRGSA